jgi:hypothetical protein
MPQKDYLLINACFPSASSSNYGMYMLSKKHHQFLSRPRVALEPSNSNYFYVYLWWVTEGGEQKAI